MTSNTENIVSPTNLSKFIAERQRQKEWHESNGYYNGNLETNGEYRLVTKIANHCGLFIDIGYNEGVVSNKFQNFNPAISIIGFEPNPRMPTLSSKHKILRFALSDKSDAKVDFFIHREHSGVSSLNTRTQLNPSYRKDFDKIEVSLKKFDEIYKEILPETITGKIFVKIDVEGSEAKVFRGAKEFFKEKNPIGYFEYSEGWKESNELLQNLFYQFNEINYSLYRITPLGLEKIRFFHQSMENYIYQNIFFAPSDYLDSFWIPITIPWDFSQTQFYIFSE